MVMLRQSFFLLCSGCTFLLFWFCEGLPHRRAGDHLDWVIELAHTLFLLTQWTSFPILHSVVFFHQMGRVVLVAPTVVPRVKLVVLTSELDS